MSAFFFHIRILHFITHILIYNISSFYCIAPNALVVVVIFNEAGKDEWRSWEIELVKIWIGLEYN